MAVLTANFQQTLSIGRINKERKARKKTFKGDKYLKTPPFCCRVIERRRKKT
jgi:hypothetical protein